MGKGGEAVSISALSEKENIPPVFLEQIFFRLRKAGIVSSSRGPKGGFFFAQPLDKLTVRQILDASEENLDLVFCDKHSDSCKRVVDCMSHHIWHDMNTMVNSYFDGITLASILEKSGQYELPANMAGTEVKSA
jgi:Rrf2 family iron-sulfur cluster assembly transcriptional regulator